MPLAMNRWTLIEAREDVGHSWAIKDDVVTIVEKSDILPEIVQNPNRIELQEPRRLLPPIQLKNYDACFRKQSRNRIQDRQ